MNHSITIREYEPTDKDAVINLIRLNIPKYFAPTEETDLNYYLDHERELYYVLLFDGQIVGCGGKILKTIKQQEKSVGIFYTRNIKENLSAHSY